MTTDGKIIEEQILIDNGKALEIVLPLHIGNAVKLLGQTKLIAEKLGYFYITMKYSSGEFFGEESRITIIFYGKRKETYQEYNSRVLKEATNRKNAISEANKIKLDCLKQEVAKLEAEMKNGLQ